MRPQEHLAEVVAKHGVAAGGEAITELLETGLKLEEEHRQERRAVEKEGQVANPFFSEAGKCERAIYKRLIGEKGEPFSVDSLANFKLGHAVEEFFGQTIAMATGGQVVREVSVEVDVDGTRVSGRSDFLVTVPDASALVELKKTSSRQMSWLIKNKQEGRPEHRRQANLYLHASQLGEMLVPTKLDLMSLEDGSPVFMKQPMKFDVCYLTYIIADATKGEPVFHSFPVAYNEFIAKSDLTFLKMQADRAAEKDDPGIPEGYKLSKFPCSYCQFARSCWGRSAWEKPA